MNIDIYSPGEGEREQYYPQIAEIIRKNVDDFVVWDSYTDPESEYGVDLSFFDNYRRESNSLLLARDGDTVCGFMTYDLHSHREDIPVEAPFTYLSLMVVDEPYRGNGIATRFYERFLHGIFPESDGATPIALGTWEGNEEQRHLMDKFGFTVCARKPYHRANGDDTLYYIYRPEAAVSDA